MKRKGEKLGHAIKYFVVSTSCVPDAVRNQRCCAPEHLKKKEKHYRKNLIMETSLKGGGQDVIL